MKLAIYGYGNLGKGAEMAAISAPDAELVAIFTGRDPSDVVSEFGTPVYSSKNVYGFKNEIDVLLLCHGSSSDLPLETALLASYFSVVDSFDNHGETAKHFSDVNDSARLGMKLALVSAGWDPGLFSLFRLYASALLPGAVIDTFWGRGVSQGHSEAARRIKGVIDARAYTIPDDDVLFESRMGTDKEFSAFDRHKRICYVVTEDGADRDKIRGEIMELPGYFKNYRTEVYFISDEEMKRDHMSLPHGGEVICRGKTGVKGKHKHSLKIQLQLDSNPEFTGSVLIAFARGVKKLYDMGIVGAITPFDIPPSMLSPLSHEEQIKKYL